MTKPGVIVLESGTLTLAVSLSTGCVLTRSGMEIVDAGVRAPTNGWTLLDRSPISVRLCAGTGVERIECRYELHGRQLERSTRVGAGEFSVSVIHFSNEITEA